VALALALLLLFPSTAGARPEAQPQVPVPSAGNVTVARLTLKSSGRASPKLALADARALPADAFAVAMVNRTGPSRFDATVAIVWPRTDTSAPPPAGPTKFVGVKLPAGTTATAAPQIVRNALYANRVPSFALLTKGTASVLGGDPPLLPLDQIARDTQLLALDRNVPLADMGLLGMKFITLQLSKVGSTGLRATVGISGLGQVSAIELRFPTGVTAPQVTSAAGTGTLRVGNPVQLVATQGVFQAGIPYTFTFRLNRPLKSGDAVTVRASAHYFESSLPFTERFFVG